MGVPRQPWLPLAVALLLAGACGGPAAPSGPLGGWPMYRGDLARDGHPAGASLGPAQAGRLALAWSAPLGASIDGSPAVRDGLVVAGTEGGVVEAHRLTSGALVWRASGLGPVTGSPTLAGGSVLVGTSSGRVWALDLANGRPRWTWLAPGERPDIWSSPAVAGGRVLAGVASPYGDTPLQPGRLVALGLASGRLLWDSCVLAACRPGGGIWSSPAVDRRGRAYVGVGNPDDAVLAVDAATGRRLWETSLHADQGRDLDVGATPAILGDGPAEEVAVGSTGGDFALLDAASGRVEWRRQLVDGSAVHGLVGSPAYDGRQLYVPSASPPTGVIALSAAAGGVRWRHGTAEPVYSSPAVGRGTLVVGTGAVFGDSSDGAVTALSTEDGHVLWSYDAHAAVWSSPAIAGDEVCVGDHAGTLRCFRPPS